MTGLLNFAHGQLEGSPRTQLEPLAWSEELVRFEQVAQGLEKHLQQNSNPKGELYQPEQGMQELKDAT